MKQNRLEIFLVVTVEIITKPTFSVTVPYQSIRKELSRDECASMVLLARKRCNIEKREFKFSTFLISIIFRKHLSTFFRPVTSFGNGDFSQIDSSHNNRILSLSFEIRKREDSWEVERLRSQQLTTRVYFWMSRGRRHEPTRIACIYVIPG